MSNETRRHFLKKTAVGGVAATTLVKASQVIGSEANSRVKIGIVGHGGRGRMIAGLFHKNPKAQLVGVADYFPAVATAAVKKYGLPEKAAFSGLLGYQRLLDSGAEGLVLKNIPYFFPEQAGAAVKMGRHLYVAKPIAPDVFGSVQMGKLAHEATKKKTVFLADFQWRHLPYFVQCVKYIREGKMGKIRFLRAHYNDEGRADVRVRENISELFQGLRWCMMRELGGGRLVAAGIHAVDTALQTLGKRPESCCGVTQISRANPINSADDTYSLTYSFGEGVTMNYSGDQFRNYHHEVDTFAGVTAYADHAYMETFYGKGQTQMRSRDWRYKGGENPNLYGWGAEFNVNRFVEKILAGDTDNTEFDTAVDTNLACCLGRDAGLSGENLTWDKMLTKNEKYTADLKGLTQ